MASNINTSFLRHGILSYISEHACCRQKSLLSHLLVVEDDVWQPYPVARDSDAIDAAEVFGIPHEQLVAPLLIQPHVGRHHLIFLILREEGKRCEGARAELRSACLPSANKRSLFSVTAHIGQWETAAKHSIDKK